jgi:hypothetical protein
MHRYRRPRGVLEKDFGRENRRILGLKLVWACKPMKGKIAAERVAWQTKIIFVKN